MNPHRRVRDGVRIAVVACSREYHDRLRAFPPLLWQQLPLVGVQHASADEEPDLELRDCDRCASTLAREVGR